MSCVWGDEFLLGQPLRPPSPRFSFMQLRLAPFNPAARPAGLGGAFIGIADDATAAAINPAGLGFLTQPEISLSHALGRQALDFPAIESDGQVGTHRDVTPIFDQTLVNIVYPRWGFTFALYRQLAFRSEFSFPRRQFLTFAPDRPLTLHEQLGASGNFPGLESDFYSEVVQNALVVAKALHRRLRIGATLATTQFRLRLHERHYFDPGLWLRSNFTNNPTQISDNRVEGLYRIYDLEHNEFKPSWNLGFVVELDPDLNLGFVYQHLPTFNMVNRVTLPAYRLPNRTPKDEINFVPEEETLPFQIDLPDKFGIGLAWKPGTKTLIAADVLYYRNRSLLRGLRKDLPQDNQLGTYIDPDGKDDVETKDLYSFHGGIEYRVIKSRRVLPIRFGMYTEPNFGLQAISSDVNLQREYPKESFLLHFTWGIGIRFGNVRFEGSVDISSRLIESIGSAVVRF
jgi:hypothetical protein